MVKTPAADTEKMIKSNSIWENGIKYSFSKIPYSLQEPYSVYNVEIS
jgi:hypothetical protein